MLKFPVRVSAHDRHGLFFVIFFLLPGMASLFTDCFRLAQLFFEWLPGRLDVEPESREGLD
jgi:hypothetical protein